ncbi:MAG: S-layer homology domain-containing protein [Clostridia bacterium]|nr:S-layer homology domain-containing protein [Clostridia bacterium]
MKKLLCLFLAVLTVAAMIPVAITAGSAGGSFPFKDVPSGEWYRSEVEFAWENGLMRGVSDTTFEPESPMTRAMFVTILCRLSGEDTEITDRFRDVPSGEWYAPFVGWAAKTGLVLGYPDGTFRPENNITRQEVAATLVRYANYAKMRLPGHSTTAPDRFSDDAEIEDWAADYVNVLRKAGIFNGDNKMKFNPSANITRAEAATILHNILKVTAGLWDGYVPDPEADRMAVYGARYLYWGGFALQGKLGTELCDGDYPYLDVYPDDSYADADHVSSLGETSIPLKSYEPLDTFGFSPTALVADLTKTPIVRICYEYVGGEPEELFSGYVSDRYAMASGYRSAPIAFERGEDDAGFRTAVCDTADAVASLGAAFGTAVGDNVHVMIRPFDGAPDGTGFRVRYIALFETKEAANAYRCEEHADYLRNYRPDEEVTAEKISGGELDGYLSFLREKIREIKESPSSFTPEDAKRDGTTAWYVSSIRGSHDNDGLSPETPFAGPEDLFKRLGSSVNYVYKSLAKKGDYVFFERGSVFYPWIYYNHIIGTLTSQNGVNYGAYGDPSAPKPVFKGSFDFGGGCGDWRPTEWADVYVIDLNEYVPEGKDNFAREDGDIGKIIFNDGEYMGVRVIPNDAEDPFGEGKTTRNMYEQGNCDEYFMSGGTSCLDPNDALRNNLEYIHDFKEGKVYLRCKWGNPADYFDSVDLCRKAYVGGGAEGARYDNLAFLYSSYITFNMDVDSVVTWCEAGYAGGCLDSVGTGIGGYGPCESLIIDHCYIHDVEDGPMGTQECGEVEGVELNGVVLTNNIVTTSQNLVELFSTNRVEGEDGLGKNKIRNARVEGNIGAYLGYGYPRTVDSAAEGLAVHNWYYGEMVDCVYKNNTLIACEGSVMGAHVGSDNNTRGWLAHGNTYVLNPKNCYILRGTDGVTFTNLKKSFYASYKMPYADRYLSYLVSRGIEYGSKFYTFDENSEAETNKFFVTNAWHIERGLKP